MFSLLAQEREVQEGDLETLQVVFELTLGRQLQ